MMVCSLFLLRTDFLVDVVPASELIPKGVVGHEDRRAEGKRVGGQLVSGRFWRAASPIRDSGSPCRVRSGQWLHYDTHRLRPYAKLQPHSSSQVTPPDRLPRLRDLLRSRLSCHSAQVHPYSTPRSITLLALQSTYPSRARRTCVRCLSTCASPAVGPPRLSPACLVFFVSFFLAIPRSFDSLAGRS